MPNPRDIPKLHLNEHLSPRLAQQLRKHGFDISSTLESNLVSKSDPQQLEFCCTEKRAILTFNVDDFTRLHDEYMAAGKEHWNHYVHARTDWRVVTSSAASVE